MLRVTQLIDSLDAGGAERMAVNLANGLNNLGHFSSILTTRKEGALKANISEEVVHVHLNKKGALDIKALHKARKFISDKNIQVIHAHGSSFFFAFLIKLITPSIKIVWHDHLGSRINNGKHNKFIKWLTFFFHGVIVVNRKLGDWHQSNSLNKAVLFLPNFAVETTIANYTKLKGKSDLRMVCLANLKNPKNHLFLVQGFHESNVWREGWTLHLVGADYQDEYASNLKRFIRDNGLKESVYLYGSRNDISGILRQADIGVLASTSEGFPVTLLEYGGAGLAVLTTSVGYCKELICHGKTGLVFSPTNRSELIRVLKDITTDKLLRTELSQRLKNKLKTEYSEKEVCQELIKFYNGE